MDSGELAAGARLEAVARTHVHGRSACMINPHATEAAAHTPLTVDTEGLAAMLGLSKSWIEKRVASRDWVTGRIPVPLEITPNRRLWLRSAVIRWAEDTQARAEARVSHMSGGPAMSALWRIRQHSCIDVAGRVVDVRTEKGIGHPDVVAWRVRWDAPGYPGRSRTFTKSAYPTAREAHAATLDFVDELRAAARDDQPADERGRPAPRTVAPDASGATVHSADGRMTLEALGQAWIAAAGGAPKTVQQHERSLKFALEHLPPEIIADDVSSTKIQDLLMARRFTPGTKASKLVRMGALDPSDDRARMCAVRTEILFMQDLRNIFTFGTTMKPPAVHGHPMQSIKARSKKTELKDPSAEYTFEPVDVVRRCITVRGTEGDAPRRLTPDGSTRSSNHLKQRDDDEERVVDYPATPAMDAMMAALIAEARRRHRVREEKLVALLARYRAEAGKEHLARQRVVELRAHRSSAPRLFTMPDGRPFNVSDFDHDVWKPALRRFFPIDDPTHEDYTPQREARFYDLRSSAIEFWIEELDMDESQAANKAGHSVHVQRLHYRKARANAKRPEKLEEASAVFELDEQPES